MGLTRTWWRRLGRQVRPMGRAGLAAAVALAALAVAGGVWLAVSPGSPSLARVFQTAPAAAELDAARHTLIGASIPHETREGQLLVPADHLADARAALAEQPAPAPDADRFETLARSSDLWSTEAQNAQRWQAAKMAALSELIARFPSVRSASVIVDGGSPRRLGRAEVAPTAAVELCMVDGQQVTPELTDAVADLVAGSIAGMKRQDVRIVDSAGRSYWAAEPSAAVSTLAAVRQAESYYARKIEAALDYVQGIVVTVHVAPATDGLLGNARAMVSIPRSYLHAVCSGKTPLDDAQFQAAAEPHLARLRQAAMNALGSDDEADVQMNWHHDVVAASAVAVTETRETLETPQFAGEVAGMRYFIIGGVCVAAAGFVLTAKALRRRARLAALREAAEALEQPADEDVPSLQIEPLAFLAELDEEQLIALARDEHPQTVALIMANVQPPQAAAVLASLPAETQVQVVKRLASLTELDEQVLRELAHGLAGRVARLAGEERDDARIGRIAEILHHAGYHTECRVLDGLLGNEPLLAETLRSRMFAFEDIANLPEATLRAGLEGIDNEEIAIALRTAGKQLCKKVLAALDSDTARQVRRDMDRIGPVRLSDVEAAQRRLVEAVRQARYGRYVGHAHRVGTEMTA